VNPPGGDVLERPGPDGTPEQCPLSLDAEWLPRIDAAVDAEARPRPAIAVTCTTWPGGPHSGSGDSEQHWYTLPPRGQDEGN
jgi:hypothetical protein